MSSIPAQPRERVDVLVPPPHLRGAVVCAIVRRVAADDRAQPLRADVQANPYACLNLVAEGAVDVPGRGALPRRFLTGPFTGPVPTQVAGPLRSVSIVVQPWLLPQVFGLDATQTVDRILDLDAQETAGMGALFDAAAAVARDLAHADALWSALDAVLAPATTGEPALCLSLLRTQGVRAAAQSCGLGERQYRRRFMHHMGLRPSAWVRVDRLQTVLQGLGTASPPPPLGELALDAGYADQAHMTREARSLARRSPGGLAQALQGGSGAAWSLQPARPISSRREPRPPLPSEDDLP